MGATGPKISSFTTGISVVTFVRIVGSKKFGPMFQKWVVSSKAWKAVGHFLGGNNFPWDMRTQIRDLFSANFDLRAAADSIIHKTSNSFDCRRRNQRTMGGLLIKPIATWNRLAASLRRRMNSGNGSIHSQPEVSILKHNERCVATKLQAKLLQGAAGLLHEKLSDPSRPREGDFANDVR
ncbi:hypothetical protein KXW77_009559 [Aspergillus fumigatus]|nr:hypothetical protein KXW77_009559 [Aspergillus fumigatus]